ncbi:MAG: monovalent cation/H+ antiporter subunit D family protein [Pseudomonadales bacterium]
MTLEHHLPALQVVVPLLTAPLVAVLRPKDLAWAAATAASAMAFAISVTLTSMVLDGSVLRYEMGGWPAPYGIELVIDSLSALVLLLVTGSSTVALLMGRDSVARDMEPHRQPLFYAAWLTAMAGLAGIAVTGDAFNVFVFMEISSLATYVLIAGGTDRRALTSVFKYLIMGTVGATFYLIGVGFIYMMTGTLNFADMEARIADAPTRAPLLVAAGFITVGLALKAAVFPLHVWLPNAYAYAPHVVTAFIAASSTKVALYVLLRFDFLVFQGNLDGHAIQFADFMLPLAVAGVLFGSAVALYETNLKRLLGYSSIAQIGYMILGASLLDQAGVTAGVLHMFNHALAKGALFLALVLMARRLAGFDLLQIAGIGRRMPWTTAAFLLAAASLIGIPGTAGFVSKWYLVSAAFAQGAVGIALVVVIVASSLMALAYLWRVLEPAYFGTPLETEGNDAPTPLWPLLVLWVAALANVYFGLFPQLPVTLANQAAGALLGIPATGVFP